MPTFSCRHFLPGLGTFPYQALWTVAGTRQMWLSGARFAIPEGMVLDDSITIIGSMMGMQWTSYWTSYDIFTYVWLVFIVTTLIGYIFLRGGAILCWEQFLIFFKLNFLDFILRNNWRIICPNASASTALGRELASSSFSIHFRQHLRAAKNFSVHLRLSSLVRRISWGDFRRGLIWPFRTALEQLEVLGARLDHDTYVRVLSQHDMSLQESQDFILTSVSWGEKIHSISSKPWNMQHVSSYKLETIWIPLENSWWYPKNPDPSLE